MRCFLNLNILSTKLRYFRKSSILPNGRKERNKHVEGKTNKQNKWNRKIQILWPIKERPIQHEQFVAKRSPLVKRKQAYAQAISVFSYKENKKYIKMFTTLKKRKIDISLLTILSVHVRVFMAYNQLSYKPKV